MLPFHVVIIFLFGGSAWGVEWTVDVSTFKVLMVIVWK